MSRIQLLVSLKNFESDLLMDFIIIVFFVIKVEKHKQRENNYLF